jgi:hypothetical protein
MAGLKAALSTDSWRNTAKHIEWLSSGLVEWQLANLAVFRVDVAVDKSYLPFTAFHCRLPAYTAVC